MQQVQASAGALRADLRADLGALSASSAKLNDKMDQLLLSFLVCQSPNRQQPRRRRAKAAAPRRAATPWTPPELDATPQRLSLRRRRDGLRRGETRMTWHQVVPPASRRRLAAQERRRDASPGEHTPRRMSIYAPFPRLCFARLQPSRLSLARTHSNADLRACPSVTVLPPACMSSASHAPAVAYAVNVRAQCAAPPRARADACVRSLKTAIDGVAYAVGASDKRELPLWCLGLLGRAASDAPRS